KGFRSSAVGLVFGVGLIQRTKAFEMIRRNRMSRIFSIAILGGMAVSLASAGYIPIDLSKAQGSITVSGSGALAPGTTAISGTGTNTFVNTLFSNVMSTAPAPAPSANPQFFGNSSIDTVPFVIDSNSAGQAAYGG